jgi:hypothetical protein
MRLCVHPCGCVNVSCCSVCDDCAAISWPKPLIVAGKLDAMCWMKDMMSGSCCHGLPGGRKSTGGGQAGATEGAFTGSGMSLMGAFPRTLIELAYADVLRVTRDRGKRRSAMPDQLSRLNQPLATQPVAQGQELPPLFSTSFPDCSGQLPCHRVRKAPPTLSPRARGFSFPPANRDRRRLIVGHDAPMYGCKIIPSCNQKKTSR